MATADLTGRVFGRLMAFMREPGGAEPMWRCACECGATPIVRASHLRSGKTKSCGCLRQELKAARLHKHGASGSPEYKSWEGMKTRCLNPNFNLYKRYGGRGITVCDRWMSFELFLADMGERPGPGYTLDRIDPDGNYEPGNCRWATSKQQQRNRTNNRLVTYRGVTAPVSVICEIHGREEKTVRSRLATGASIDVAMLPGRLPRNTISRELKARSEE